MGRGREKRLSILLYPFVKERKGGGEDRTS